MLLQEVVGMALGFGSTTAGVAIVRVFLIRAGAMGPRAKGNLVTGGRIEKVIRKRPPAHPEQYEEGAVMEAEGDHFLRTVALDNSTKPVWAWLDPKNPDHKKLIPLSYRDRYLQDMKQRADELDRQLQSSKKIARGSSKTSAPKQLCPELKCARLMDHDGPHWDQYGSRWDSKTEYDRQKRTPKPAPKCSDPRCVRPVGHGGYHEAIDGLQWQTFNDYAVKEYRKSYPLPARTTPQVTWRMCLKEDCGYVRNHTGPHQHDKPKFSAGQLTADLLSAGGVTIPLLADHGTGEELSMPQELQRVIDEKKAANTVVRDQLNKDIERVHLKLHELLTVRHMTNDVIDQAHHYQARIDQLRKQLQDFS